MLSKYILKIPKEISLKYVLTSVSLIFVIQREAKELYITASETLIWSFINEELTIYENSEVYNQFKSQLRKLQSPCTKKLMLKGLGLRATLLNNKLDLKLGYSHIIHLTIPLNLNLTISKSLIVINGANWNVVGNFAFKIRSLKKPNIYKGKGIWFKKEKMKLKAIKKT